MNASLNAPAQHKSLSHPCDFPQLPQVSVLLQTAIRGQGTCLSSTDPKDTMFIPPLICLLASTKHSVIKVCTLPQDSFFSYEHKYCSYRK